MGRTGEVCPDTSAARRCRAWWRSPRGAGATTVAGCKSERSEEHTSELQSQSNLVCRLLLEKKKAIAERLARIVHAAAHSLARDAVLSKIDRADAVLLL